MFYEKLLPKKGGSLYAQLYRHDILKLLRSVLGGAKHTQGDNRHYLICCTGNLICKATSRTYGAGGAFVIASPSFCAKAEVSSMAVSAMTSLSSFAVATLGLTSASAS